MTAPHRFLSFLLAALALAASARAQDPIKVLASVESTTVGDQDIVAYSVEISGGDLSAVRAPVAPETENLALVQPVPSTSRSMQIVNGLVSQSLSFQWLFRPVQQGSARIGESEVAVYGKVYRTDPIRLSVVPQSQRPSRGMPSRARPFGGDPNARPDPADELGPKDLFVSAAPTKRHAYQGEQIGITYKLFFRRGVQIRQSRLADSWDAEGFWREELETSRTPLPEEEVVNGLRYSAIPLKRVAVFPTRSGTLSVDPLKISTDARAGRTRLDPFDRFFSLGGRQYGPIELASPPVEIRVEPLPAGAPDEFRGAVGQYTMDVSVSAFEIAVGEALRVTVRLRGTGNLATLEPPEMNVPGVFETYDPTVTLDIDRSGSRVRGGKVLSYVLVPRAGGTFTLPPVRFAYFDPRTERYEALEGEAHTIRVEGPAAGAAVATATLGGLPVDDIAAPARTSAWVTPEGVPLHRRTWPYLILGLPLVALLGLVLARTRLDKIAADPEALRRKRAHPLAQKHLKEAEALRARHEARAFYAELDRALLGFLAHRMGASGEGAQGWSRTDLDRRLAVRGASPGTRARLRELLDECDRTRFAPIAPDAGAAATASERAAALIVALDAELA